MNRNSNQVSRANHFSAATQILRFCIVLGTVLYMAFAAMNTLSFLVSANDRQQGTFLLQANRKAENFGANRSELILKTVILDGRRLRWDFLASKTNWQTVDQGGSPPLPSFLLYSGVSDPASLTFQGRKFVAIFQANNWPGVFRVKRNGTDAETLTLRNPAGHQGWLVLESPASLPSPVIFVVAFIFLAGCAYWFGPVRSGQSSLPWLFFFLSVVHALFWAAQCIGTTNDSPGYVEAVSKFFREGQPSYFPPGYPALLGLVGSLSGDNLGKWVTLIQHGMVVLGAVWIYLLLRRIVPEEAALLGAILGGASAPSLTVSQIIMSEATTLFAMVGALYFTVRCAETGRLRFLFLAGVLAGWAGTLRVVPLVALIPSMCVIYLLPSTKRRLRLAVMTLAVTVGFVALPISWCWYKSGEAALTNSMGLHLFNRVVTEQQQLDKNGPATKTLIDLLGGKDPKGVPQWQIREDTNIQKLGYFQQERLLRRVATEGILKDPWAFVASTPYLAWKVLMADASSWLPGWGGTSQRYPSLENAPFFMFTASSWSWRLTLEEIHKTFWPVLCWLAIAGVFIGLALPQHNLVLALAWVPIGYLLSSASVEYFNPRFNAPIIHFVTALAMIPLASLFMLFEFKRSAAHQPVPERPSLNVR